MRSIAMDLPRLRPPCAPWTVEGWCLYQDDAWSGPVPHEWDDEGWWVYPDKDSAIAGVFREMRRRADDFDAGRWPGGNPAFLWYPKKVTYLHDGRVRDETGAEFEPGCAG